MRLAAAPLTQLPAQRCSQDMRVVGERATTVWWSLLHPRSTRQGRAGVAFITTVEAHIAELQPFMQTPPQTNEVGRASAFLGALLPLRSPLHLREIGASAGLNLLLERYRYQVGDTRWGPTSSATTIRSAWRGSAPALAGEVRVISRRGCDRAALSVADPAHRARLRAFVWADHVERLRTLDGALEVALREPPQVDVEAAETWLPRQLGSLPDGLTVVLQSVVSQYMSAEARAAVNAALRAAGGRCGSRRALAHLSFEPAPEGGMGLALTLWPGGNTRRLARCDPHGRWAEWLPPQAVG